MRPIKFRVWDGVNMVYPDWFATNMNGKFWQMELNKNYDSEIYPIMQFTGLLDRNGKEIWEGDVVAVPNDNFTPENGENPIVLTKIWYMAPSWMMKTLDGKKGSFNMQDFGNGEKVTEFEIIGNIYDNPTLLK